MRNNSLSFLGAVLAMAVLSQTSLAVTVSYTHELPPTSVAGDVLLGVVGTSSDPYYNSFGGLEQLTNGSFVDHWWFYNRTWTVQFKLGSVLTNLGSVDIWIEDADGGRWYLPSGRVSVSLDGSTWLQTAVDNTGMSPPVSSGDLEINRIHLDYALGEVPSFQYLMVQELAVGSGGSSGTPRIKEITAFLNTQPQNDPPSTSVPEPMTASLLGFSSLVLALSALRRQRLEA